MSPEEFFTADTWIEGGLVLAINRGIRVVPHTFYEIARLATTALICEAEGDGALHL